MIRLIGLINLIMAAALTPTSTQAAEPALTGKTGLAVGKKAPEWTLKDQDGKNQPLSSFLKQGPVALVFYRSADW